MSVRHKLANSIEVSVQILTTVEVSRIGDKLTVQVPNEINKIYTRKK